MGTHGADEPLEDGVEIAEYLVLLTRSARQPSRVRT
jgi:hypothetical protein